MPLHNAETPLLLGLVSRLRPSSFETHPLHLFACFTQAREKRPLSLLAVNVMIRHKLAIVHHVEYPIGGWRRIPHLLTALQLDRSDLDLGLGCQIAHPLHRIRNGGRGGAIVDAGLAHGHRVCIPDPRGLERC